MSTVITVIILNFHHRGDLGETVPHWMEVVVLDYMSRAVGLHGIVEYNRKKHKDSMVSVCGERLGSHNVSLGW